MIISKLNPKRRKESNQYMTLYHLSDVKISKLMPRSSFRGFNGLFFTPSYRSGLIGRII